LAIQPHWLFIAIGYSSPLAFKSLQVLFLQGSVLPGIVIGLIYKSLSSILLWFRFAGII